MAQASPSSPFLEERSGRFPLIEEPSLRPLKLNGVRLKSSKFAISLVRARRVGYWMSTIFFSVGKAIAGCVYIAHPPFSHGDVLTSGLPELFSLHSRTRKGTRRAKALAP